MVDLMRENYHKNAELLLKGLWYSELPDLLDVEELISGVDDVFAELNSQTARDYKQDEDGFVVDWKSIVSPPYIRSPGVEALSFFDFKKNKSLREMQIPHLIHYIAFMYNTLLEFEELFKELYIDQANARFVGNSNSYLVFEDEFLLYSYEGEEDWALAGTFTTKNNKISSSAVLNENKRRLLAAEADYLYSLTLLQIWHYYILFKYSTDTERAKIISSFGHKRVNPLVAASMVVSGTGKNKELFNLIRESYINESDSTQWKKEIMYSKWWLPLFKIARYDSHEYDGFMHSKNFPEVLQLFPLHPTGETETLVF